MSNLTPSDLALGRTSAPVSCAKCQEDDDITIVEPGWFFCMTCENEWIASGTVAAVADSFSSIIRSWTSSADLAAIILANMEDADSGICHTHDFFDANEAMMGAFEQCGLNPHSMISHTSLSLWGAAWTIAKDNEFSPLVVATL